MDLFLMHGESDELSLQDMIEKDMKGEFGMSTSEEFTAEFSLNPLDSDMMLGSFEPLFDLNGFSSVDENMEVPDTPAASSSTHSSCSSSSISMDDDHRICFDQGLGEIAWLGSSSHKDMTFDLEDTVFVNPSSVLPNTYSGPPNSSSLATTSVSLAPTSVSPLLHTSSPSPMLSSSPASLSSNAHGNVNSSVAATNTPTTVNLSPSQTLYIKTDSSGDSVTTSSTVHGGTQVTVVRPGGMSSSPSTIAVPTSIMNTCRQQHVTTQLPHRVQISSSTILSATSSNGTARPQTLLTAATQGARFANSNDLHHSIMSNNASHNSTTSSVVHSTFRGKPTSLRAGNARRTDERALPKPAYSYSCLIALALKNSASGSLPVSEIYSFMCEYFPYFRTAPNGWKNSVRHNLSLNKCFEKIEKPVVSGNNQRKGCLWALNPNKVHKMDEEIQKWSKKDLQGIKDAMSSPEVLSALERGEMKFEATHGTSSCSEDEEEDEEVDTLTLTEANNGSNTTSAALATLKFVNGTGQLTTRGAGGITAQLTPRVSVNSQLQSRNSMAGGGTIVGQVLQPSQQRTTLQIHTSNNKNHSSVLKQHNTSVQLQAGLMSAAKLRGNTSPAVMEQPDFILPDSTMTEISFPAGGTILDDLGNEISIEEEEVVSSHNGVASNVSVVTTPTRSLVFRKLPVTPVRSPTSLRTNYVYSPSISSPHQHNLNRLVLTNAKMA